MFIKLWKQDWEFLLLFIRHRQRYIHNWVDPRYPEPSQSFEVLSANTFLKLVLISNKITFAEIPYFPSFIGMQVSLWKYGNFFTCKYLLREYGKFLARNWIWGKTVVFWHAMFPRKYGSFFKTSSLLTTWGRMDQREWVKVWV